MEIVEFICNGSVAGRYLSVQSLQTSPTALWISEVRPILFPGGGNKVFGSLCINPQPFGNGKPCPVDQQVTTLVQCNVDPCISNKFDL